MKTETEEVFVVCAWCGKWKVGGSWLDPIYDPIVQAYKKMKAHLPTSHGICHPCKDAMLKVEEELR